MKIKCEYTKLTDVPTDLISNNKAFNKNSDFYIDLNAEYTVYGLTVRDTCIWYYISDSSFTYYPKWKPSFLFEVIDPRLSRYWIYSLKKLPNYSHPHPIITFPEWANNHPDFYDKLTDKDQKEEEIFNS